MVKGGHVSHLLLLDLLLDNFVKIIRSPVEKDDLSAIPLNGVFLQLWSVTWHNDCSLDAEQATRKRHTLP